MKRPVRLANRAVMAVLVCAAIVLTPTSAAGDGEVLEFQDQARCWKDATGKFEVVAALAKYQQRELTLHTNDGKSIVVPIDRISKRDQAYAINKIRLARRQARPAAAPSEPRQPVFTTSRRANISNRLPKHDNRVPNLTSLLPKTAKLPVNAAPTSPQNDEMLFGVHWQPIDRAEQLAAEQDKPIMWFRVLGDLSGFM